MRWEQQSFDVPDAPPRRVVGRPGKVTVVVAGVPVTQGSMKAHVVNGHAHVTHVKSDRINAWRSSIVDAVHRQLGEEIELMTGPIRLSAAFRLPRPKATPKRRRTWPIGKRSGDSDKFLRCLGDALTGVLIEDDALIVDARVTKDFAGIGCQPGVVFTLEEIVE